jgi:23S rRNA pseudouridine1911/1915/1917 synthase
MSDQVVVFRYDRRDAQRLDKFLVDCLPEFSRARLQALIADGLVLVNEMTARKGGQIIQAPASVQVCIPAPKPTELKAEQIPLDVIFENQDLLVVNKPAGMVVHPALGHPSGTLVNAALAHDPDLEGVGGEQRPGVVHRLDKDTSGLILLAKNDLMHRYLQDQFRLRKINKTYLALVDGHPPTPDGRIEAPVGRDGKDRKLMAVVVLEKGREAISEYHTLEVFPEHTLVEVHPITGRTHQIRLHMAFIGCPVVGDKQYGRKHFKLPSEWGGIFQRHFLHAIRLTVQLPGETKLRTFEAPLPDELTRILQILKKSHAVHDPLQGE